MYGRASYGLYWGQRYSIKSFKCNTVCVSAEEPSNTLSFMEKMETDADHVKSFFEHKNLSYIKD
jgi:hypothetical protein